VNQVPLKDINLPSPLSHLRAFELQQQRVEVEGGHWQYFHQHPPLALTQLYQWAATQKAPSMMEHYGFHANEQNSVDIAIHTN